MTSNWICRDCGSYDVFESVLIRINRLSCIIDDVEDVQGISNPLTYCNECSEFVIVMESDKPLYKEI